MSKPNAIYQEVTDKVLALMETAGDNWIKPFTGSAGRGGIPINYTTKKHYKGMNVLMLAFFGGYPSGQYASYKQWQAVGAQVRKGERGQQIIFFKPLQVAKRGGAEGETTTIPMVRYSTVFAREQVDGLPALDIPTAPRGDAAALGAADAWIRNTGAHIVHTLGRGAFYSPAADSITLPPMEDFKATPTSTATELYYSTALHELAHWTGHKERLARLDLKNKHGYAFEELIAELAACFQCVALGVSPEPRPDHAQYLNGWKKSLQDDPRALFQAAAAAQRAVDYIAALQPGAVDATVDGDVDAQVDAEAA